MRNEMALSQTDVRYCGFVKVLLFIFAELVINPIRKCKECTTPTIDMWDQISIINYCTTSAPRVDDGSELEGAGSSERVNEVK